MSSHARVLEIYRGSDGAATRALYAELEQLGAPGVVAAYLLRASKSSERAKVYRGGLPGRGSFRAMAYDRKQWAMGELAKALTDHAAALAIGWGWGEDPKRGFHSWVLYVELPTGQVSFHTDRRGTGPDAPRAWDGIAGVSATRICRYAAQLLDQTAVDASTLSA